VKIKLLRLKQKNSKLYVIYIFSLDFLQLLLIFIDFAFYVLLQIEKKFKIDRTFLGRGVGEFPENVSVQTEMLFADDNLFS
jgi:hypothetical protein